MDKLKFLDNQKQIATVSVCVCVSLYIHDREREMKPGLGEEGDQFG